MSTRRLPLACIALILSVGGKDRAVTGREMGTLTFTVTC